MRVDAAPARISSPPASPMNLCKCGILLGFSWICLSRGQGAEPSGNLIMNGAFEAGNQYWKGDGKVVTLPEGNKVYQLEAASNRLRTMSQDFRMHGLKEVQIVFRARNVKYTGKSLRISVHRPGGGSVLFDRDLPDDGSWKDFHINYAQTKVEEERRLVIAVHEGSGAVQIDNVEVRDPAEPAKPPPPATPTVARTAPTPTPPPQPTPPAPGDRNSPPKTTSSSPGKIGAAGTYPSAYLSMAQTLMSSTWNWKASGGNYNGVTTFGQDGLARDFPGKKVNGDWRIDDDGTLTYRRGDDFSLVWQLKEEGPGRYAGGGIAGAALHRTCTLTLGDPLPPQARTEKP